MLSKYTAATLLVAALANAQATHNQGDACTGDVAYCASGSGNSPIILRCTGSKLQAGNCDDNLNEPEFGALCIESSSTAGDAYCSAVAGPSTTTAPTTSSTSTSSAAGYSATGCPSTYDSSCAYFCGEAQVPFGLCESTDITGEFASCSKCPTAGAMTTTTASSTAPMSYTTTTPPVTYTTPSSSASSSSTCSPYSASACPAVANPCCAYICGEAQVPFPICQPTDGTGEFASCSKCPTMGSITSAPSSYTTPTAVVTTTAAPTTTVVPAGNGTSGNVTTSSVPEPTYIAGASSVAGGATIGLVVVMGFVGLMGML